MGSFLDTGWLGVTAKLSPWSRVHGRITRDAVDHGDHGGLFPSVDNHGAPRPVPNYITPGLLPRVNQVHNIVHDSTEGCMGRARWLDQSACC